MNDSLNRFVSKDTIIRVLLRKIKIQEDIIADLEDELRYYESPKRFLSVLENISAEEIEELKRNPYFKQVNAKYAKKEKEVYKLHGEIERLRNIIINYDMIY